MPEGQIPREAWNHLYTTTFSPEGHLILDGDWGKHFTLENYKEWCGAAVICPRGLNIEDTLVRFDNLAQFIIHGYSNPHRNPGEPDWYFFWVGHHPANTLRECAVNQGIIPVNGLPLGRGGYGIDTGLRAG